MASTYCTVSVNGKTKEGLPILKIRGDKDKCNEVISALNRGFIIQTDIERTSRLKHILIDKFRHI